MNLHDANTWINSIIKMTQIILCNKEKPSPIVIVVSNAFLNICPFTNHAYKEIIKKAITKDSVEEPLIRVTKFVNNAINA